MEMNMIVNLCILGFVVLTTLIGAIKGMFRSVITVLVLAAAIFIGSYASTPATPYVVNKIYPKIETKAVSILQKKADDIKEESQIKEILKSLNIADVDELVQKITVDNKDEFETAVKEAITPAVRNLLWIVMAFAAYILLSIVGSIIAKGIDKTPGVGDVNRLLGAILGLAIGLALVWGITYLSASVGADELLLNLSKNSEVYEFLLSSVPESAFGQFETINIPIIGEIDIASLFK